MSKTSNPQKRRRSSQNRPTFIPGLAAGGTGVDLVSGVTPVTSISGTRYGIVNNTVTQFAVNQPPIEDDGLRGCPAFTQLCKQSETLTDGNWAKNNLLTPVIYEQFRGKNIWACSENTAINAYHIIYQSAFSFADDNSVVAVSFVAKDKGRSLLLYGGAKTGTGKTCIINLQTGIVEFNNGLTVSLLSLGGGYYFCLCSFNVLSGGSTPQLSFQLRNGVLSQYTGDGVSGVYLGLVSYINFGVNGIPFIPPYSPNNTGSTISFVSETGSATNGTSFDLDNALLARLKTALRGPQGHLEITLKSNTNSSWWANSSVYNILSVNNTATSLLYMNKDAGGAVTFRTTDGTNIASVTQGLTVGSTYKISVDWGTHSTGQKIRITVNGVKSSLATCGVSLGAEDLSFFALTGIHIGWIVKDSLKISDKPQW